MNEITKSSGIVRFRELLTSGLNSIREACEIYVREIDAKPERRNEFISACPEIPIGAWAAFEMVGRNAMDYRLLWGGGRAQSKLRRLPKSEQQRLLDKGVEIAVGENDKRIISVELMDNADIDMVFAKGRVRTIDEQRCWVAKNVDRASEVVDDAPYYIAGNKLVVTRPIRIPLRMLRTLIKN